MLVLSIICMGQITFAGWYEEPLVYETENIDAMWWLSKKKKEKLKNELDEEIEKKKHENEIEDMSDKRIKWLYDDNNITRFPKNKWELIDDDNDGIAYNYYFDKDGFLLVDTITPDYKIVDIKGREVDCDFRAIKYDLKEMNKTKAIQNELEETDIYVSSTYEPAKILIGEGVVLREKKRIYDNSKNKNLLDYIDKSNRFVKKTKATIYNEVYWKDCSSLKGNGGYVIFDNPDNNFNVVNGYIGIEFVSYEDNEQFIFKVYDADEYDKFEELHHMYDIEEIYVNDSFNNNDAAKFSFTFDRSVKRLRFEIETSDNNKSRTCYLKDLKYGFSKSAYQDELIRKKDKEEEIEELKRLGIYIEDLWSFEAIDEDGNVIEENEETEHENENNDDYIGGKSYVSEEETKSYEDVVRDRNTGPAFDESLQNLKEVGPAFISIEEK